MTEGITLDHGGKLIISVDKTIDDVDLNQLDLTKNDNVILSAALTLKKQGKEVT